MRNVKEYSGMEIVIPRFLFILLAIIQLVINFLPSIWNYTRPHLLNRYCRERGI